MEYKLEYRTRDGWIRCFYCGLVSHHPKDIEYRFCGNCNKFHRDNENGDHFIRNQDHFDRFLHLNKNQECGIFVMKSDERRTGVYFSGQLDKAMLKAIYLPDLFNKYYLNIIIHYQPERNPDNRLPMSN